MKNNKMFGQEINHLTFINRIHHLEDIIFELKEALEFYADKGNYRDGYCNEDDTIMIDNGQKARVILKKYNKSWDEIYQGADKL